MSERKPNSERLSEALDNRRPADDDVRNELETARAVRRAARPELAEASVGRIHRRALARLRQNRRPQRFSGGLALRWAAALIIVALLIAAGTGTVAASSGSLPGEPLYPVKRFAEQAQLALTPASARPSLHLKFAEKRLDEIEKLAAAGLIRTEALDNLAAETEALLAETQSLPADKQAEIYSAIISLTEHQQSVLERVRARAPAAAQAGLAHAQEASAKGKKIALEAIQKIKSTPPGQLKKTSEPSLAAPSTPQAASTHEPPGKQHTPPGQVKTPPGQQSTPPGKQDTPAGQGHGNNSGSKGKP